MINHSLVGQSRRIVHLLNLTLLGVAHIANVGHGGDNVHIKLAVKSLLDNLHVQQTKESATESESQSYRTLGHKSKRSIVKLKLFERCTQILVVGRINQVNAGKHHWLNLLESFDGLVARSSHMSDGITHLNLL